MATVSQVVKLSDAVQPLPRQTTEFVHGVPDSFLRVGERKAAGPRGRPAPLHARRVLHGQGRLGQGTPLHRSNPLLLMLTCMPLCGSQQHRQCRSIVTGTHALISPPCVVRMHPHQSTCAWPMRPCRCSPVAADCKSRGLRVQGYTELLDLVARHTAAEGGPDKAPAIDCYGNGEDLPAVEASSRAKQLPLTFHGAKDHLDDSMHEYKVRQAQAAQDGRSIAGLLASGLMHVFAGVMCISRWHSMGNMLALHADPAQAHRLRSLVSLKTSQDNVCRVCFRVSSSHGGTWRCCAGVHQPEQERRGGDDDGGGAGNGQVGHRAGAPQQRVLLHLQQLPGVQDPGGVQQAPQLRPADTTPTRCGISDAANLLMRAPPCKQLLSAYPRHGLLPTDLVYRPVCECHARAPG